MKVVILFGLVCLCYSFTPDTRHRRNIEDDLHDDDEETGDQTITHNGVGHRHNSNKVELNVHGDDYLKELQTEEDKEARDEKLKEFLKNNPEAPPVDPDDDLSDLPDTAAGGAGQSRKRFVEKYSSKRWTKGVIPFIYSSDIDASKQNEIEIAQRRYEKYTCFRFVPWEASVTKEQYGLDHEGHLEFVSRNGCWSYQGLIRRASGQTISCCGRGTCTHELGHVLGIWHEHQSPERDNWIRVNWNNIQKSAWRWYKKVSPDNVITFGYDLSSTMHYGSWGFNVGGRPTMTVLYDELSIGDSFFYMFYEAVTTHDCKGLFCANFTMECVNDGYVTLIDGVCSCMCVEGLDPSNGCLTMSKTDPSGATWPGGSYALLSPVEGCPDGFTAGNYTHWSDGSSWRSSPFHLAGDFQSDYTTLNFCVMESQNSNTMWPTGVYCIYRKSGTCPEGFKEGEVTFDDEIRSSDKNKTINEPIPDGVFDNNTKFMFCCRDDGFRDEAIDLPNSKPLILMRYGSWYQTCQNVKGMYFIEEKYVFDNHDEGVQTKNGSTPYISESYSKSHVHFCYYRPFNTDVDCGGVIDLTSTEPTKTFTSPSYPSNYPNDVKCHWLVKAPESTTIVLNFNDFDIEQSGEKCKDSLEIRHARIGQPGMKYCGKGMEASIRSVYNMMKLKLRTQLSGANKGFNATVTAVFPDDLCYSRADKGSSYRGNVNTTRSMKACLPWSSATTCRHHPFNSKDFNNGLENNLCRNPDNSDRPWCYTDLDGCDRDYCDVCLLENAYDAADDCADEGANYCTEDPDAFDRCALTCQDTFLNRDTPVKASSINCATPCIADGDVISTNATTFSVGDIISIRCNSDNVTTTATCLTSGEWSVGEYVCGVCPTGWVVYKGHCYKYFTDKLKYSQAQAACESNGAIMAPTSTKEELDFVVSLRVFLRKMWLAANDRVTEGEWVWPDGKNVSYSNWQNEQPDNWNDEDCAVIQTEDTDNKWGDVYCEWYNYHPFVCRKALSEPTICKNRVSNCKAMLEVEPNLCTDHEDYAKQECRYTCGVCGSNGPTCVASEPNVNTTFTSANKTVSRGVAVNYQCKDSYVRVSGNQVRACQDGELTGTDLVCVLLEDSVGPNNKVDLISRRSVGSRKYVYSGNTNDFRIERDGEIRAWHFYTKYVGDVALQVWRPKVELGEFKYEFVGQNVIVTKDNRVQRVNIPSAERIVVQNNDIIGLYYGYSRGGIPYNSCSDSSVKVVWSKTSHSNPESFNVGDVIEFSTSVSCRVFSLTAIVGPKST